MMRGKLLKRSKLLHTWKPRIFELNIDLFVKSLRYFDKKGKLKGELILNGKAACEIQLMPESTFNKPHCFTVCANGRTIILAAGSDSAMRKWVDFLEQSGATLMGADQVVAEQEIWRSVNEAEERSKRQKNGAEMRPASNQNFAQNFVTSMNEQKEQQQKQQVASAANINYGLISKQPIEINDCDSRNSSGNFKQEQHSMDRDSFTEDSISQSKIEYSRYSNSGIGSFQSGMRASINSTGFSETNDDDEDDDLNDELNDEDGEIVVGLSSVGIIEEDKENSYALPPPSISRMGSSNSIVMGRNSLHEDLSREVQEELMAMGLRIEALPSSSSSSSLSSQSTGQCHIFVSDDWSTCSKLIIFVGNSHGDVPVGIWSRSGCVSLGIEDGSMIGYVRRAQRGGYGVLLCDTCTHSNLMEKPDGSTVKVPVRGSETPELHISSVWEEFVNESVAENVFVIAYGLGGEAVKDFLECHVSVLSQSQHNLKAMALVESAQKSSRMAQPSVRRFFERRVVNWQENVDTAFGGIIPGEQETRGCFCLSAGERLAAYSSNRAWVIPIVKDAIFRFLDFCVDVEVEFEDVASISERFINMEKQFTC